jgi:hypothetical protein
MENISYTEVALAIFGAVFFFSWIVQLSYSRRLSYKLYFSEQLSFVIAEKKEEITKQLEEKHQVIGVLKAQKKIAESKFEKFVECVKENANFRKGKILLPKGTIPQPICDQFDIFSTPKP